MMNINSKAFMEIADLLMETDNNGEHKYSVEEVADMTNVSVDTVLYVDLVAL